jgi:hypothetical protein
MKRYVSVLTALSLAAVWTAPAIARHHAIHHRREPQAAHELQAVPENANLSGKQILSPDGSYIGTVLSMSKTAQGQRAAVMQVEKRLGLGTVEVLLPISKVKPGPQGGFYTDMTRAEARNDLPKAG